MKRTTFTLTDQVARTLERLAREGGVSEANIIRWAVLTFDEAVQTDIRFGFVGAYIEIAKMKETLNAR